MAKEVRPRGDQELRTWAIDADAYIALAPSNVGLTALQSTTFHGFVQDYDDRLSAALNPETKTKPVVAAKNSSKLALTANAKLILRLIAAHPGLSDEQREILGMNLPNPPSPQPAPSTQPIVTIAGSGGGQAALRLRDQTAPDRRAKPAGVASALVAIAVTAADAPEPSFAGVKFDVVATRTNYTLELPADATVGKRLWIRACWANERGMPGPASVVASAVIAA
jgi:hypothetical protein